MPEMLDKKIKQNPLSGVCLPQGRRRRNIDLRSDIGAYLTYFPPNINRPSGFIRLFHSSAQIDSAMNGDQIIAVMARTNRNGLESGIKSYSTTKLDKVLGCGVQINDKSDRVRWPLQGSIGLNVQFLVPLN